MDALEPSPRRWRLTAASLPLPLLAAFVLFSGRMLSGSDVDDRPAAPAAVHAELVNVPRVPTRKPAVLDIDSLVGRSGALRARLMHPSEAEGYPVLLDAYGAAFRSPGIRVLSEGEDPFAFVTLAPWHRKFGAYVNGYHLGWWPGERRSVAEGYDKPDGFIEVTPATADTRVSEHFTLRNFLTHDQIHVWPKYLVLREDLLDKLELTLQTLASFGVATHHVVVLSGFRSPQYNARGSGEGMARASRHQYGDAADIIIDANRDSRMDDLNGDNRVDFRDVQVIDHAVQLVEHKYPDLVGGLGLYHAMGPSGPFAHIDVRGTRARWTNARRTVVRAGSVASSGRSSTRTGTCRAEGAMAILCAGMR